MHPSFYCLVVTRRISRGLASISTVLVLPLAPSPRPACALACTQAQHSQDSDPHSKQVDMSKKESALDLAKFIEKGVRVKLAGGREVSGTLMGYDQLLNVVLDEAVEYLRDPDDPMRVTEQTRNLGLIVCRGTAVMLVAPTAGIEEIANPFLQAEDEQEGQ